MTATETPAPAHPVVVVGGGMAGHRLAQQLVSHGHPHVVLLGEEEHPPYNRVLLAEVLAGRYRPELAALAALPPQVVRHQARAVRIDRLQRRVLCDDGAELTYSALVLATGSNPVLPPLRGLFPRPTDHELPSGVCTFRTMADCAELESRLPAAKRAVVVGGGLLGVSAARALAARGVQVLLAHQGEHLMEHQLDTEAAELIRHHLLAQQIEIHTECRVRVVLTAPDPDNRPTDPRHPTDLRRLTGVELADGFRLATELLVIATGVRPRIGLAQAAGLTIRQGIVVDDQLRTSDPHIHAIGDCAEHEGTVYGLAGPALEQADHLARVLTRPDAPHQLGYRGSRLLTRLTLTPPAATSTGTATGTPDPLDLATFGATEPSHPEDSVVRLADAHRGTYRKVIVRHDRLIGGVLLGDLDTVGDLAHAWQDDQPLTTHPLHLLTTRATHPA
ncbi:assimilatory nitrate reductase electron transfer subunit [Kitasatospora sp. MMS16-BH015]|uniref:NAD(P)/FAD-dependent oxidoreductase n=1 Tax=Kitasatospora sp. MMS16-BH015 TaxID=2018025 RepID=UPI000CA33A51|nr:FAD-dependent oxidoreductase [Kitasatospora sp. MMS16-BH015]AUG77122.1 assimilatory nitrate reductase electron transfer subunit [Kitasatospora sp. MMS16-BH015]